MHELRQHQRLQLEGIMERIANEGVMAAGNSMRERQRLWKVDEQARWFKRPSGTRLSWPCGPGAGNARAIIGHP